MPNQLDPVDCVSSGKSHIRDIKKYPPFREHYIDYVQSLTAALSIDIAEKIEILAKRLLVAWKDGRSVFLCGNGGSAGNAIHLANDLLYGVGARNSLPGIRVEALSANPAVLTCLSNDLGYDQVFSEQLRVKGQPGDLLLALSGSGNSQNIVTAIEMANEIGMTTFAILAFSGGRCREVVQFPIHFSVHDMQIAEDIQLVVGHMCMQWLSQASAMNSEKATEIKE
jgi:D-sedoheptulose 7-phosphate isomerase